MDSYSDKKEKDEDDNILPFQGLEKGLVLQEIRKFSSPKLNTKECYYLLTKILYLLTAKGETLTPDESTNVFISVTKLFQSKDLSLRRMMYLLLKELASRAEDTIIAFATLIKDVNSDVELNRANAIRVISGIMDTSTLSQMERYIKQAIVDKDPYVASSALVAGIRLFDQSPDVIKKWVTEVQEALNARSTMVQYHALGLLHKIKRKDRLAATKLVTSLAEGSGLRSYYAHCHLIRIAVEILQESGETKIKDNRLFHYIENCLTSKSELVVYEAARAICNMEGLSESDLKPAVAVLQVLLGSTRPTLRFAAVRTLNKVATEHPGAISASCTYEMENLISDPNRSVATLAITTLLKVETESSVERLMKQINNFISDISDEFKIVVVDAIRTLSLKYPDKHYSILNFLSNMLREEGGAEYKSSIVSTILAMIDMVPASTDLALDHLCEFIEDCEYTNLATKILNLLGQKGPQSSNPSRYIRYIYNRLALENAPVRASSVSALAKFGLHQPELRGKVKVLLRRSLLDVDDEVRDRATFYLKMIEDDEEKDGLSSFIIPDDVPVPLENLQAELLAYLEKPTNESFDIKIVSSKPKPKLISQEPGRPESRHHEQAHAKQVSKEKKQSTLEVLSVPELKALNLGDLYYTIQSIGLTETETATRVTLVKHIFQHHVVFQYNITNTISEQLLKKITVDIEISDEDSGFEVEKIVPCDSISYDQTSEVYVAIRRPAVQSEGVELKTCTFTHNLLFVSHEVDQQTGEVESSGFPDEIQLDEVEFTVSDYMRPVPLPNFGEVMNNTENLEQAITTFNLSTVNNIKEGVAEMIKFLGMAPCENSDVITDNRTKHILYLSGNLYDLGLPVLAKVRMRLAPQQGVGMELTVRSENQEVNNLLANAMFA